MIYKMTLLPLSRGLGHDNLDFNPDPIPNAMVDPKLDIKARELDMVKIILSYLEIFGTQILE